MDAVTDARRRRIPLPLVALGTFALVLVALTALISATFTRAPYTDVLDGPRWLDAWFHRDSGWYLAIAEKGYFYRPGRQSSIAFFPSYPLAVRGAGAILGDVQLAGSLVAIAAALAFALLYAHWADRRLARGCAIGAVVLLLVYPFAFYFYGPLYGDSLFALAALCAFLLIDRGWWLAGGLVGIVATAGRPVGLALAAGLVVRAIELRAIGGIAAPVPFRRLMEAVRATPARRLAWPALGASTSILGLIAWCAYLQLRFGDALAWVHVEKAWGQESGVRTWIKWDFLGTLVNGPMENVLLLVPQALCSLFALLALRRVQRLFGWGYAAYTAGVLAIAIIGTKDFMGTGRYVLAAFPAIAAAADWLRVRGRMWLVLAICVSAAGLATATFFYGRGYAVS